MTFIYCKWKQVVVTCFCRSGTQVTKRGGEKNKFDLAVAVVQSEGSEVAAVATLRQEHHNVQFREASMVQIEQHHEATRRMCQNSEQQHFSEATRELQLHYNRLFAQRSEHILSETSQALQKKKNTVGASAQRRVVSFQVH